MTRSSRNVTLVLLTSGLAALGFTVWDHGGLSAYSTTQSTAGGHSFGHWWFHSGSGSGSHGSSFFGGTSRGGFGSSGHSVGS